MATIWSSRSSPRRCGLLVGRQVAFGQDLFDAASGGELPLLAGGTIPAAEHLVAVWDSVRIALGDDAGSADLRAGDAIVSGAVPMETDGVHEIGPSPFGDVVETRRRPGFEGVAEAATWDFTVFRLTGVARHAYACVPGAQLGQFLNRLDAGALDVLISGFLDAPPVGRVLTAHHETATPGLWDDAVIGPDLLPYEQSAAEAVLEPFTSTYERQGKGVVAVTPPVPAQPTSSPISAGGPRERTASGSPVALVSTVPPAMLVVPAAAVAPPATVRRPVPAEVAEADLPPAEPVATAPAPAPAGPPLPPAVERHRRRGLVLAGILWVLLLAAGVGAMSGGFSGGKPTAMKIVTGPTSATVTVAPSTSGTAASTTTTDAATTTILLSTVTAVGARPTTAVPVPTTTVTTIPLETTLRTTTTATTPSTSVATTQLLVGVATGALGCVFQPPTATVRPGSTLRFRNDTADGIIISFPTPGAATTINLDAGGTSAGLPLLTAGSYDVTCTPGAGAVVGRMTITVTAA